MTQKPLSFEAFRRKKEQDQSSKFKPKPGKKAKMSKEVKVQVGLVRDKNGDGVLVRVKSKIVTLAVDEDSDAVGLLEKAVDKHAHYHKQFDKDCGYVLLYHDMSMVNNLPQSSTPFVLSKYQKDLLIQFSKMYFWLCSKVDFENSLSNDSTDSEVDMLHVPVNFAQKRNNPGQSPSTSSATAQSNTETSVTRQDTILSF